MMDYELWCSLHSPFLFESLRDRWHFVPLGHFVTGGYFLDFGGGIIADIWGLMWWTLRIEAPFW